MVEKKSSNTSGESGTKNACNSLPIRSANEAVKHRGGMLHFASLVGVKVVSTKKVTDLAMDESASPGKKIGRFVPTILTSLTYDETILRRALFDETSESVVNSGDKRSPVDKSLDTSSTS